MNIFGDKVTTSNANETPVSVPTVWTQTAECAERQSAKTYSAWLRQQIVKLQDELADVEAFLRGESDAVGQTDSADE